MSARQHGSGNASAKRTFDRTVAEAVRQAALRGQNDANFVPPSVDASSVLALRSFLKQPALPVVFPPVPLSDVLHAADYGVVGDGVHDDTSAMQDALDDGAAQHKVVSGGNLKVTISGPLTMTGPGLVFNMCSFGNSTEPIGIQVTGSGYTGLTTTTERISHFFAAVWGTGNTANGIYFNQPSSAQIQKVRVYNFDGFGVKIDEMFDSTILDIAVELCGNASNYAFSLNAGGDTSNMSHIGRIQCEQGQKQVMKIDNSTLSCVIDNIHSERATADAAYTTWDLGLTRGVFNAGRFTCLNPTDATIIFRGENTTFNSMAVEDAISITFDATATSSMTFVAPNFAGATLGIDLADHSGLVQILGGMVGTYNVTAEVGRAVSVECVGTKIAALDVGDCGNPSDPGIVVFRDCKIDAITSSSSNSAATFDRCTIAEGNDLLEGCTVLTNGTVVTCASTLAGSGCLVVRDSTVNANVLMADGSTLIGSGISRFHGTLGQTTNCSSLLGAGCYATGAVSGLGIPAKQPNARALTGSIWNVGQRHHNLAAAAGGVPGWVCTTAGGNGTFVFKPEAVLGV